MNLIVNGEDYLLPIDSPCLLDLINSLGISNKKFAVEHNLEIVPKEALQSRLLSDGDKIEIVHFIGGG